MENPLQGPYMYWQAELGALSSKGVVDIWMNQSDCSKPGGAPTIADAKIEFRRLPDDYDLDGDGCTTPQDLGTDPAFGGARDPYNKYDHMDMNKDGFISIVPDILGVAALFGPVPLGTQGDVGRTMKGSVPWAHGPADGAISIVIDILGMAAQFGHNCF